MWKDGRIDKGHRRRSERKVRRRDKRRDKRGDNRGDRWKEGGIDQEENRGWG